MMNERVSDNRLAEMLAGLEGLDGNLTYQLPGDMRSILSEIQQRRASVVTPELSFAGLRQANAARQLEWDAGGKLDLAYRGNEFAGEAGEVCNVIKKLERERLGIRGSRDTVEHLAEELADAVMTADLIANQVGIDLAAAIVTKFNATSEANGISVRLTAALSVSHETAPARTVYVAVDHTGCIHSDEDMERVISIAKANEASVKQAAVSHETGDGETEVGPKLWGREPGSGHWVQIDDGSHTDAEVTSFEADYAAAGWTDLRRTNPFSAALPATTDETQGVKREDEGRLPTREEAAHAAAVLIRCNGHDLDVWTDGEWPSNTDFLDTLVHNHDQ